MYAPPPSDMFPTPNQIARAALCTIAHTKKAARCPLPNEKVREWGGACMFGLTSLYFCHTSVAGLMLVGCFGGLALVCLNQ